ncbi:hypothetical protein PoB_006387100 [Plakobranchus ocellatus]|uniref:Uncharacterized protein n=1 Tax=Plakobranchus ocellatus TaxID=259542 RepID=A0AAV4D055_9GAST|nr:hypothetical protein PoB_006387100 [Plakobranchus ocellatus]
MASSYGDTADDVNNNVTTEMRCCEGRDYTSSSLGMTLLSSKSSSSDGGGSCGGGSGAADSSSRNNNSISRLLRSEVPNRNRHIDTCSVVASSSRPIFSLVSSEETSPFDGPIDKADYWDCDRFENRSPDNGIDYNPLVTDISDFEDNDNNDNIEDECDDEDDVIMNYSNGDVLYNDCGLDIPEDDGCGHSGHNCDGVIDHRNPATATLQSRPASDKASKNVTSQEGNSGEDFGSFKLPGNEGVDMSSFDLSSLVMEGGWGDDGTGSLSDRIRQVDLNM